MLRRQWLGRGHWGNLSCPPKAGATAVTDRHGIKKEGNLGGPMWLKAPDFDAFSCCLHCCHIVVGRNEIVVVANKSPQKLAAYV